MTDTIDSSDSDFPDEDPVVQLQGRVAELLAELSEATDAPASLETCAPFTPGDVDFGSGEWMSRVADVQGWFQFDDELDYSDPAKFAASLSAALGISPAEAGVETSTSEVRLTEAALERLGERAELAARLQHTFLAELDAEGGSQDAASASWFEAWSTEDDVSDQIAPEPVTAKADVWHIFQLTKKKLNLTPSYQRGDVWRTGDRQALIESILRGIPLPSIILLRTGGATPHDVVDGKQRLTAILRFVGQHPVALETVADADRKYPEAGFRELFRSDYPKFRRAWKRYMGVPLTAKLEDDYYFPFKLRNDSRGGLVGADLEPLRSRYFTDIKANTIRVADQEVTVEELFEGAPDYKVPVIEYTKATQRQIHEVFKLYNKQGMHLNAEEIRNAVYHDVELTRAILVAAGDASSRSSIDQVAPSLVGVPGIEELGKTLSDYGFGSARYRRTKVLGWITATLINDSKGKLLPSTARYTDQLLSQVQENDSHPLRDENRIADLIGLIAEAAELHAAHDELWPDRFRGDGKSSKWQDLQLVGTLLGIAISHAGAHDDLESRIQSAAESIRSAALNEWQRPAKTQTRTQWDYIARIAQGVIERLEVDLSEASDAIRARFGSSGVESLLASRLPQKVE